MSDQRYTPRYSLRLILIVVGCIAVATTLLRDKFFEHNAKYLIPKDLHAFLGKGDLTLDTTAEKYFTVKEVEFYPLDELRVKKFIINTYQYHLNYEEPGPDPELSYELAGVDLLRASGGYAPEGILIWFPQLKEFGCYDGSHAILTMLPGATWKDIEANPSPYINCQWFPELQVGKLLRPWADPRCKDMKPSQE